MFIVALNSHTRRQNEKPSIAERRETWCHSNMEITASLSWNILIALLLAVYVKSDTKYCVKNRGGQREKFKPRFLPPSTELANHCARCVVSCRTVGFEEKGSDTAR